MFDDLFDSLATSIADDALDDYWGDALFGVDETESETEQTVSARALRIRARRLLERKKHKETLQNLIESPPKPGESIHVVGRNFNAWDWVPAIGEWVGAVDELYLCTWGIAMTEANEILRFIDEGKVRKEVGVAIGRFFKKERADVYFKLAKGLSKVDGWLKACKVHAKVILMSNEETGDYFTIEGSGNLTMNPNVEQYCATNDKELWEFHRKWMREFKRLKDPSPTW